MHVTEDDAITTMQSLLEHTASRILDDKDTFEAAFRLKEENGGHLDIACQYKIGTDGASGFVKRKQISDCEEAQAGQLVGSHLIVIQLTAQLHSVDMTGFVLYCTEL